MKKNIHIIIAMSILISCRQHTSQNNPQTDNSERIRTEIRSKEKINDQKAVKKVGKELFNSILDTINMAPISVEFLVNKHWLYKPFDECESYLKFQENGKGVSYNCEMEEVCDMTYKIVENKVFIAEYDIPHVDNEQGKKIKYRDDTYVYNGYSLILIDSKMYNIGGIESIPQIENVINYVRIELKL